MLKTPYKPEIDHHAIKLLIGIIAILLAGIANQLSGQPIIESISESYHRTDWARNMFVGSLFAIFTLLITYNGRSWIEWLLGKIAAFAALGVALFPCGCGKTESFVSTVHGWSAGVMFLVLAVFCYLFILRAKKKGSKQAKGRIWIYSVCCFNIVLSVVMIAVTFITNVDIETYLNRPVYVFEALGLISFGVAWVTASRMLPIITHKDERISIAPFTK